jgi:hypothetical protein
MPVREMKPERTSEHHDLVAELAAEWSNPNSGRDEPIIFIERDRDDRPAHIYVIWSRWGHLETLERGEIIMDAAAKQLSPDDLLNITMAFGMTQEEARRMNFKF